MEVILDCESYNSALTSLSSITNIKGDEILKFLSRIDLDAIYDDLKTAPNYTPNEFLLNQFITWFDCQNLHFSKAYFFHSSRLSFNSIENIKQVGLLPLNEVFDSIKCFVDNLAKINNIISDIAPNQYTNGGYQIGLKFNNSFAWGPWGFLIKECAINKVDINHDYLRIPEIVEDYISSKWDKHKMELERLYFHSTKSIIVKFSTNLNDPSFIGNVLYYLYLSLKERPFSIYSNTCYSNNGVAISNQDIISIAIENF